MARPYLLIAPTYSEYRTIRAAVADRLAGGWLRLALCGVGPARAAALCRRLERADWSGGLALVGWAGGLAPGLAAGDVVMADAAVDGGGQRLPLAPAHLCGTWAGPLLCVDTPVVSHAQKRAARATGAVAVEMEAYPIAAWAAKRGLHFVHARVILDTVEDTLPDLDGALDVLGRPVVGRLARRLLAQPGLLPSLWHLARRVAQCEPVLRGLARAVVAAAQPSG